MSEIPALVHYRDIYSSRLVSHLEQFRHTKQQKGLLWKSGRFKESKNWNHQILKNICTMVSPNLEFNELDLDESNELVLVCFGELKSLRSAVDLWSIFSIENTETLYKY